MSNKILSSQEIINIAGATTGQSNNPKWFEYRKDRLTGSLFGQAIRAHDNPTPYNIATLNSNIAGGKDLSHIEAVQWGREFENSAIASYCTVTGRKVKPTGLWLFPNGYLGASPDGLVYNQPSHANPSGILEVKCPYSVRFLHYADMLAANNLPRYITSDFELDTNHDYYHQVQGQLYATQAAWCDFVMWTTKSTLITRVYPSRDWVAECIPKLSSYYINHYLPTTRNEKTLSIT